MSLAAISWTLLFWELSLWDRGNFSPTAGTGHRGISGLEDSADVLGRVLRRGGLGGGHKTVIDDTLSVCTDYCPRGDGAVCRQLMGIISHVRNGCGTREREKTTMSDNICRYIELAPRVSVERGMMRFDTRRVAADGSIYETGECFIMPMDEALTCYANMGAQLVRELTADRLSAEIRELHVTPPLVTSSQAR